MGSYKGWSKSTVGDEQEQVENYADDPPSDRPVIQGFTPINEPNAQLPLAAQYSYTGGKHELDAVASSDRLSKQRKGTDKKPAARNTKNTTQTTSKVVNVVSGSIAKNARERKSATSASHNHDRVLQPSISKLNLLHQPVSIGPGKETELFQARMLDEASDEAAFSGTNFETCLARDWDPVFQSHPEQEIQHLPNDDDHLFTEFLNDTMIDRDDKAEIFQGRSRLNPSASHAALSQGQFRSRTGSDVNLGLHTPSPRDLSNSFIANTWDELEVFPSHDHRTGQSEVGYAPESSSKLLSTPPETISLVHPHQVSSEIEIDGNIEDEDLIEFADHASEPRTPPPSRGAKSRKLQWNAAKDYRPTQSSPLRNSWMEDTTETRLQSGPAFTHSSSPNPYLSSVSPLLKQSPSRLATVGDTFALDSSQQRAPIPFVDPLDQSSPVKDRSPIPGLTSYGRIFTHFRLGSALNHAAMLRRCEMLDKTLMELYARVLSSTRSGHKQQFEFADIFNPARPPRLHGEWIGWEGLPYYELDGSSFLDEQEGGKLCRAVGRIMKDQETKTWRMCILSIWQASWNDIEVIKGIMHT